MTTTSQSRAALAKAGKYLTFVLGREHYGVPVLKVREIIRLCSITQVPHMPDYIKGVINLRGKIISVLDLRLKFRLSSVEDTARTCIVVVQLNAIEGVPQLMGIIVDAVEEVVSLPQGDIEPTPEFGPALKTDHIIGMAKVKGVVKTLLDIDQTIGSGATLPAVPTLS